MIKLMKKFRVLTFLLVFMLVGLMSTSVFAANGDSSTAEAKVIINSVSGGGTFLAEYYYDTVEEAFSSAAIREKEHNSSGKGGVVTVTLQLLKDSEVTTTLVATANNSNVMVDFNGCSIVSSADPAVQAGPMTFVTNSAGTACSITQKNVTTVSTVAPNTIFYAPAGTMMISIAAPELTIGDNTGTAINSKAMLPSIMNGIFLGKLEINKPMFGAAVSGGLFSEDPTPHIDTNAYDTLQNDQRLYYLTTYHGAIVNPGNDTIIQKYGLLQDAIDNANPGELVRVLKQGYPPETIKIASDSEKLLDLAGFQLTGAASPTAAIRVEGTSLIQNNGYLTIVDTDLEDPGALNFVYDATFEDEAFTTIRNQGHLYLDGVSVSVNYNQPNYEGNIYTLFNDSSNGDAVIRIYSGAKIGGLKLEPEDPATGKYPAFATKGNGIYTNLVEISYGDDFVSYYVENCIVGEIIDVFDAEGNYTTTLSLRDGSDLQKEYICVKKDGIEIDFEYDSTTDVLTVPANAFTNDADFIEISLKHKVSFIVDNEIMTIEMVEHGGQIATLPVPPQKEGYTATWSYEGTNITEDIIIEVIYTPISNVEPDDAIKDSESDFIPLDPPSTSNEPENVDTGDDFGLWLSLMIVSVAASLATLKYTYKNN